MKPEQEGMERRMTQSQEIKPFMRPGVLMQTTEPSQVFLPDNGGYCTSIPLPRTDCIR